MSTQILSHKTKDNNNLTNSIRTKILTAIGRQLAPNKHLDTNTAKLWLTQIVEAKSALNVFQWRVNKWIENGEIPLAQFSEEFEQLALAGLEDWADNLLGTQLCTVYGKEISHE